MTGQDLVDKHLALTAEAELKGCPEIAAQADELWRLHEQGLAVLDEMLQLALDRWIRHIQVLDGDEPHSH